MLFFWPGLKIAATLAIFHISEKVPVSNDELKIAVSGLLKISTASFNSFTGTCHNLQILEHLNFFISV